MTFNSMQHPRGTGGRFVRRTQDEARSLALVETADDEVDLSVFPAYESLSSRYATHTERIRIDERTEIEDQSKRGWNGDDSRIHHQWLIVDGHAVAMLHYHFAPSEEPHSLTACDIEVKPTERGKGFGRRAIEIARARHGNRPMWTTGSFSESGAAAFAKHLPVLPYEAPHVSTSEYQFVHDWEKMWPTYPLS